MDVKSHANGNGPALLSFANGNGRDVVSKTQRDSGFWIRDVHWWVMVL
jgi:hypothetical protein